MITKSVEEPGTKETKVRIPLVVYDRMRTVLVIIGEGLNMTGLVSHVPLGLEVIDCRSLNRFDHFSIVSLRTPLGVR